MAQWLACWAHNPKIPGSKPGSAMPDQSDGYQDAKQDEATDIAAQRMDSEQGNMSWMLHLWKWLSGPQKFVKVTLMSPTHGKLFGTL